ncbi:transforming growth factor-beta-induced protein ig-h3 [Tribolium madens]|uniref:transforming growth factor-beta-induced protein ig-h3 n=1 Tax=Tribolium madens TaxID=41895 RepID=UPI001CF72F63|nr:transforming growth factor-beta-induced protein ig-h3 [Tribolium madens]
MLKKAFVLSIFISYVCCQRFNEFHFVDPFSESWNWHSRHNLFPRERDVEEITERDREPLSPNYQDPATSGTEEKPVLKPKTQKPSSYNPSVIPGGVVDIDAVGSPQLPTFPEADFGFSSFGGGAHSPVGGGLFGLGGFFGSVSELKPWWKGPNVCIEREESADDDEDEEDPLESKKNETEAENEKVPNFFSTAISLSSCRQSANKYECVTKINNHGVVKTFTVRYKCCYGFVRTKGGSGCEKQLELKPLLDTISDLDAKVFRNLIQSTGLEETFKNNNYTVFVPTDAALNDFNEKMLELNNVDLRGDAKNALSNNDLVLSHAVAGFVDLTDYSNEDIIYSENKNSSIRINTYPTQNHEKMVTVNCAKITKPNNLASNGIAYLIDGVATPATQSIEDIIKEHKKLSNFRKVLESTDSFKNLRLNGHYTIFAPTDEAFNKLEPAAKQKLLRGDACAVSILKHHVTAHTVCSAAIMGNATTHNIEGEILNLERTSDDQLILEEKAKMVETDIMAINGVIHLIDTVLIPDSALHINAALKNENLTKFSELIEQAGFVEDIDNLNNATVFAPSNEAFEDPKVVKLLEEIKGDKEKLRDLILYHTLTGQLQSCDMNNNALLKTNDHDKELRLNLYSTLPLFTNVINRGTINCAKIVGFDEKSCGSVIHEVSKVLLPPTQTILDLINADSKYSTLSKIIKGTEVEKILQENNRSVTFLAPTDETLAAIDEADLKTLKEDKEKATTVLKNHILTEVLCCSGVGPQSWGFNTLVPTMTRQHHQVGRTGSHQIRIGRAVVTSCDNLATNGVLHTVNKVLFPQRPTSPSFGGFFLFDF